MSTNGSAGAEGERPAGDAPFQFSLKHLLIAPVALALMLGLPAWLGALGVLLFFFLCGVAASIWYRSVECFLVSVVAFLLAWLVTSMAASGREDARRAQCANQLKQIGLALHNYHATWDCFPPAYALGENGRPMHSWRLLIWPYITKTSIFDPYDYDEPWNGPNNGKLAAQAAPNLVLCPAGDLQKPFNTTSYLAVVGPGAAWPGEKCAKLGDFPDPSNTILVVEVVNSGVHWMEPRDLDVGKLAPGVNPPVGQGISGHKNLRGANVLMADGTVRFLPDDIPAKELDALLSIDGGD